ncbi:MAG: hypothetical protein H7A47_16525 [Verrucomicrobiales bacterium]|nr:hypothetical protein [Verrucomicrobiales bacterium]
MTPGNDGAAGNYRQAEISTALFDMRNDPYETRNAIDSYPEVAARLQALAEAHRREFYTKPD